TVMLVAQGYPGNYEKGKVISGIEDTAGSLIFHAGTKEQNGEIVTNGGRVMAVTSFGETLEDALKQSYANIQKIRFEGKNYRKDIGYELFSLARTSLIRLRNKPISKSTVTRNHAKTDKILIVDTCSFAIPIMVCSGTISR